MAEACIVAYDVLEASSPLLTTGLKYMASTLLDLIYEKSHSPDNPHLKGVMLAGYGLGGIIIKEVGTYSSSHTEF